VKNGTPSLTEQQPTSPEKWHPEFHPAQIWSRFSLQIRSFFFIASTAGFFPEEQ